MAAAVVKTLAYKDEVAALTSDAPEAVGTVAAVGDGTTAARDNHVHILGADCVGAANIADDAVGSEHIEALSDALDFAHNQATGMALENAASDPAALVVGQIWYDTATEEVKVCKTAAV